MIRGIAEPISHLADARGPHGADRGALELKGSLGGAAGVRLVASGCSVRLFDQHEMTAFKVVSPGSDKVMATPRFPAAVAAAASTSLRWTDRRVELVLLLAAQR